jgi:hypothetical protein
MADVASETDAANFFVDVLYGDKLECLPVPNLSSPVQFCGLAYCILLATTEKLEKVKRASLVKHKARSFMTSHSSPIFFYSSMSLLN